MALAVSQAAGQVNLAHPFLAEANAATQIERNVNDEQVDSYSQWADAAEIVIGTIQSRESFESRPASAGPRVISSFSTEPLLIGVGHLLP